MRIFLLRTEIMFWYRSPDFDITIAFLRYVVSCNFFFKYKFETNGRNMIFKNDYIFLITIEVSNTYYTAIIISDRMRFFAKYLQSRLHHVLLSHFYLLLSSLIILVFTAWFYLKYKAMLVIYCKQNSFLSVTPNLSIA